MSDVLLGKGEGMRWAWVQVGPCLEAVDRN